MSELSDPVVIPLANDTQVSPCSSCFTRTSPPLVVFQPSGTTPLTILHECTPLTNHFTRKLTA